MGGSGDVTGRAVAPGLLVRHDEGGDPDELVLWDDPSSTVFHAETMDDDLLWLQARKGGRAVTWWVSAEVGPDGKPVLRVREEVEGGP